jgi:hypothetical protein
MKRIIIILAGLAGVSLLAAGPAASDTVRTPRVVAVKHADGARDGSRALPGPSDLTKNFADEGGSLPEGRTIIVRTPKTGGGQ